MARFCSPKITTGEIMIIKLKVLMDLLLLIEDQQKPQYLDDIIISFGERLSICDKRT